MQDEKTYENENLAEENKVLDNQENKIVANKSNILNVILIIAVVILMIMNIYTNNKIDELETNVGNTFYALSDMISNIKSSIEDLNYQLSDEASVISAYEYSQGEVNTENLTMELNYSVTPKQVSDDTKVYLQTNDGDLLEMKANSGTEFTLEYNADLTSFTGIKQVIIKSDGVKQSVTIDEFDYFNARYYLAAGVDLTFNGDITTNEDNELKLNGELSIQNYNKNQDVEVKSAQVQIFTDDELVMTYDLDETNCMGYDELADNESASTEVGDVNIFDYCLTFDFDNLLLEVNDEQNYQVCVVLTYDNGFTHHLVLFDSCGSEEGIFACTITENDGILYSPNGEIIPNNNN